MRGATVMERLKGRMSQLKLRGLAWWQETALPRYQALQPREQKLLLLSAMVLPLLVLVFGLVLPVHEHIKALQKDVAALEQQASEAERLARVLQQKGAGRAAPRANAMASVERLARKLSLRSHMTRIRPLPGGASQRLMLQMKNAPYDQVIRFARALTDEGLALDSMKIQQGEAPGQVHASLVIAGG